MPIGNPGGMEGKAPQEKKLFPGTPLTDIISELKQESPETVIKNPRDYYIEGPVTEEALRELLDFKYEVSITEQDGRMVLTTGSEGRGNHTEERHTESQLSFHTHPGGENGLVQDGPSIQDIYSAMWRRGNDGVNPVQFVAHVEGIVIFQAPPDVHDREALDYHWKKFLSNHFNQRGAGSIEGWERLSGDEKWNALPDTEKVQLVNEFGYRIGVIHGRAKWGSEEAQRIIGEMNRLPSRKHI